MFTIIYSKQYPQSLLKYFRSISLRGIHLKPPTIGFLLTLVNDQPSNQSSSSQSSQSQHHISNKNKKKQKIETKNWKLIPPSLNCLRYTRELWIQCFVETMMNIIQR